MRLLLPPLGAPFKGIIFSFSQYALFLTQILLACYESDLSAMKRPITAEEAFVGLRKHQAYLVIIHTINQIH